MLMRKIAILTVGCLSLAAFAQGPADRPAGAQNGGGSAHPTGRPGMTKLMERNEKEFPDALVFFKEHCPKLAAAYDKMPEEKQKNFRPMIMVRYLAFKTASSDGAELKALKLRQLGVEDRLFDLKNRLIDAQEKSTTDVDALKTELKQVVVDLIEVKMEERRVRIARLEKLLSEERADLEKDQSKKAEMIEKRYQEVLDAKRPEAIGGRHVRSENDRPKRPEGDRSKRSDNPPK